MIKSKHNNRPIIFVNGHWVYEDTGMPIRPVMYLYKRIISFFVKFWTRL